jgi:hypothetical protein
MTNDRGKRDSYGDLGEEIRRAANAEPGDGLRAVRAAPPPPPAPDAALELPAGAAAAAAPVEVEAVASHAATAPPPPLLAAGIG